MEKEAKREKEDKNKKTTKANEFLSLFEKIDKEATM